MATKAMKMGRGKNNKKQKLVVKEEEEDQVLVSAPNLLPDIIEDILSRLPVKTLIRFRCVSKPWQALLTTDPIFIQKHLARTIQNDDTHGFILRIDHRNDNYYNIPNGAFEKAVKIDTSYIKTFDPLSMIGSSNGLVCLFDHGSRMHGLLLHFWNPATRECKTLPRPLIRPQPNEGEKSLTFGFGFHPIIKEYKVVRLVEQDEFVNGRFIYRNEVEVYSSSTKCWKRLGVVPYISLQMYSRSEINGIIHWIASEGTEQNNKLILSFDMADEVFRELPLPAFIVRELMPNKYVLTFKGCLCIATANPPLGLSTWIMTEYGVKESWTKLFSIVETNIHAYPLIFSKNGEIVAQKPDMGLVSYNTECKKFKKLRGPELGIGDMDALCYVETLVPVTAAYSEAEGQHANGERFEESGEGESSGKRLTS